MSKLVITYVTPTAKQKTLADNLDEYIDHASSTYGVGVASVSLAAEDQAGAPDDEDIKVTVNGVEHRFDNDLKHGQYETVLGLQATAYDAGYHLMACELS